MAGKRIDEIEKEKRIHQISLMLRKKSVSFIVEYIKLTWGIGRAQAYNYLKSARKEWQKHFANVKRRGMGYHLAKRREIRAKAIEDKDYRLALDMDKDEAKLLGLYIDRKKIGRLGSFAEWMIATMAKEKELKKNGRKK